MKERKRPTRKPSSPNKSVVRDEDDAPELTEELLKKSSPIWRIGNQVVPSEIGRAAMRRAIIGKSRVNIFLDDDVIAFFKSMANGRGYQTLINAGLRTLMEQRKPDKGQLIDEIRQVVREELRNNARVAHSKPAKHPAADS